MWLKQHENGSLVKCCDLQVTQVAEQSFKATLTCRQLDHTAEGHQKIKLMVAKGITSRGKKATVRDVYQKMWEYITKQRPSPNGATSGADLQRDAWLGDRILAACLAISLEDAGTCATARVLNDKMSIRACNEELVKRMSRIGLKSTGHSKMDASRVEQWVWQQFVASGRDLAATQTKIQPLLK